MLKSTPSLCPSIFLRGGILTSSFCCICLEDFSTGKAVSFPCSVSGGGGDLPMCLLFSQLNLERCFFFSSFFPEITFNESKIRT